MKITAIRGYQVDLPLKEGRYNWSGGNFMEVFDSTVVAVDTDEGSTGYAECCPLGSAYLPSYAKGVRAGIAEIGPKLIGLDPTDLGPLNRQMDAVLRGHLYVKAPIDIARIKACRAILQPGDILVADANTGWTMADAARVVNAVRDVDVYIEQPCMTYEESVSIRRRTSLPFVLDENIGSVADLLKGIAEDAFDVINLKISKVGGLTKAKLMRDLCVANGIPMTIEDTWGGDIVTATIAHLARSTPKKFCFTATDFNSYGTVSIADGAPQRVNGRMTAPDVPGLGIAPKFEVLGEPVLVIN